MLNKLIANAFVGFRKAMNVNFEFDNELLKENYSPTLVVESI